MRPRPAALLATLALTLGACGAGHHAQAPRATEPAAGGETQGGGSEADKPRDPEQRAAYVAYYVLATASGRARAVAAPVVYGKTPGSRVPRRDAAALVTIRRSLAAAKTRDSTLAPLPARLLAELERLVHRTQLSRPLARHALATTSQVNAALRTYALAHPDVASLVPE